ncbi:hypothetical protein ABLE92_11870 [Gordonia sp. VNQ95]|uniref:hypothetical protein n=1 Tax=Gordonia sp. VNQ95 TaxID=3156619 RepID=UPI0032B5A824
MTDFFVLPGTRVPLEGSDMPSYQPDDDGPIGLGSAAGDGLGGGGVVQVVDAEWGRRAAVARGLAGELGSVIVDLRNVIDQNHYGSVPEGEGFYSRLINFVSEFCGSLDTQTQALHSIADQCDLANTELHAADGNGATSLTT